MFLFDKLFGRRDKTAVHAPLPNLKTPVSPTPAAIPHDHAAPGTHIRHHPELIQKFKKDHQVLLQLFMATKHAADAGDAVTAAERLQDFRSALQDHLLSENVRLYVYLEHALVHDAISHGLVHEFRREMDEIGKVVVGFIGQYQQLAQHPDMVKRFAEDLDGIGKVLVKRIQREEETLYPLYQPV